MNALRRALMALGVTVVAAAIVRLRGSGGTPPQRGGWREVPATELPVTEPDGAGAALPDAAVDGTIGSLSGSVPHPPV